MKQEQNFRSIAVIQARLESTRLPRKALADIAGRPLLYHVIERARAIKGISLVVLATGLGEENIPLVELAESMGIETYAGSINNVLQRFCRAAEEFDADYIVRITGDNPFTDSDYASLALEKALNSKAHLSSLTGLPLGTAVEIIERGALERARDEGSRPYHFEHVTPYIKEHPDLFTIKRFAVDCGNPFPDLRLTVDTEEDLELTRIIYRECYHEGPFPLEQVIALVKERPDLVNINSAIKQRPMTHSSGG